MEMTKKHKVIGTDALGRDFRFESIAEAARQTGASGSVINQCIKGKRETSGGYKWREDEN